MRHPIGDFVLDVETRQLLSDGREVELSPKAFALLRVLAEARPRALPKDELQEKVWPKTFVSEANLSVLVSELRRALGDSPRAPRILRTVYGFGYALAAPVPTAGSRVRQPAPHRCELVLSQRRFALAGGETIIGRAPDAGVVIDHPSVSRYHARLVVNAGVVTIEDLGSKNGTFVHGEPVSKATSLSNGDTVGLGVLNLIYREVPGPGSTRSAPRKS